MIGKGRSLLADGGLAISVSDPTTLNGWYPFNGDNGQVRTGLDRAAVGLLEPYRCWGVYNRGTRRACIACAAIGFRAE